ncbi:unnamed protein product [Mesocestoides corti]|uniref:Uncharacterized protein n=1 Tax=Mesocestoides corti TaxID=53468 RepID=A0A0R3UJE7_MESCO|nr:unnamed protein product [Mesocestoides corti]
MLQEVKTYVFTENTVSNQHSCKGDEKQPGAEIPNELEFVGSDLIREAEARAKARSVVNEQANCAQERGSFKLGEMQDTDVKKLTSGINNKFKNFESIDKLEPTRPTADNTNQTQKELLERRMSERPPESHTVRPPWFTEEKKSHRSAPNSKTKPGPEQNWGFQRTCNQIDFPTYSAKEMRDARPIVVGSRHEKCSWMPSLAPDFIAEKRNVGRPLSDKLLPSGDSAAGRASTSIVSRNANDVNIPPYPKISAPYAMD